VLRSHQAFRARESGNYTNSTTTLLWTAWQDAQQELASRVTERLESGLLPQSHAKSKIAKMASLGFDTGVQASIAVIKEEIPA
jgi:hypothetical protein